MIALQWKFDLLNGWAQPIAKVQFYQFFVFKMSGRLCSEAWHDAPVLDSETLEGEQKNEEAGKICYNANAIRTNDALSIVIPNIEDFICAQG